MVHPLQKSPLESLPLIKILGTYLSGLGYILVDIPKESVHLQIVMFNENLGAVTNDLGPSLVIRKVVL